MASIQKLAKHSRGVGGGSNRSRQIRGGEEAKQDREGREDPMWSLGLPIHAASAARYSNMVNQTTKSF